MWILMKTILMMRWDSWRENSRLRRSPRRRKSIRSSRSSISNDRAYILWENFIYHHIVLHINYIGFGKIYFKHKSIENGMENSHIRQALSKITIVTLGTSSHRNKQQRNSTLRRFRRQQCRWRISIRSLELLHCHPYMEDYSNNWRCT